MHAGAITKKERWRNHRHALRPLLPASLPDLGKTIGRPPGGKKLKHFLERRPEFVVAKQDGDNWAFLANEGEEEAVAADVAERLAAGPRLLSELTGPEARRPSSALGEAPKLRLLAVLTARPETFRTYPGPRAGEVFAELVS